jgi:hypothetical protein
LETITGLLKTPRQHCVSLALEKTICLDDCRWHAVKWKAMSAFTTFHDVNFDYTGRVCAGGLKIAEVRFTNRWQRFGADMLLREC